MIKFTYLQIIIILIIITLSYYLVPNVISAWINPKYNEIGNMEDETFFIRLVSFLFTCITILVLGVYGKLNFLTKTRTFKFKNNY